MDLAKSLTFNFFSFLCRRIVGLGSGLSLSEHVHPKLASSAELVGHLYNPVCSKIQCFQDNRLFHVKEKLWLFIISDRRKLEVETQLLFPVVFVI